MTNPGKIDLFEVTQGQLRPGTDKPRSATHEERNAYLRWLADRRGVAIPDGATFDDAGIFDPPAKAYVLTMPGYGASNMVTMETTDDAGNVIRRVTMATDKKGAIPLKAKRIQEETGLPPLRAKKPVRRDTAELRAAIGRAAPTRQTAPVAEAVDWQAVAAWEVSYQPPEPPVASEITPSVEPAPVAGDELAALHAIVAELSSRMAALEQGEVIQAAPGIEHQAVARRDRSPAHIRAIRSYLAMRAARNAARAERDQAHAARAAATVHANRVYAVEESLIGARGRGDRMVRLAVRQRAAMAQHQIDGRGYRAEIGALRRQLQTAQMPPVLPAPQPGAMAVAFQALNSRVAVQAGG